MTTSLRTRLILSYLAIAILTATLIYLLIRLTSDQRLKSLVLEQQISEIEAQVTAWYEQEGSWDGFTRYYIALHPPPGRRPPEGGGGGRNPTPPVGMHGILDVDKRVLIRFLNFEPNDIVPEALLSDALPVIVEEQTVGWIIPAERSGISLAGEENVYLQRTNQVLLIAGAVGVGVALLMGFGFARILIRPIEALTQATEQMAKGDLKQQVPIQRTDELGKLAASFNAMSHEVALAHQRRRQMTADIAHDLSTPLQIASGYIEAIQDGSLPPTPERLATVVAELDHLRRLITDLDLLAETDTKTLSLDLEPVVLANYLPQVATAFKPLAVAQAVDLCLEIPSIPVPEVRVDQERLTQVLGNLINNALRYTPSGGTISLIVRQAGMQVLLQVRDTGAGISADALPFIFDRFYQTDQQRSRAGKMGLGLTISKGLVEAMGGTISAESSGQNHGTLFTISLPTWQYREGQGIAATPST